MKEIYNSQHIYTLIETSFCPDIEKVNMKNNFFLIQYFINLFFFIVDDETS